MAHDERGYLIVPHEIATGADCEGCLIVEELGDTAKVMCNECDTVVDEVPLERAASRLVELASKDICSARCPHCGALNTFPGFRVIQAFICSQCGEGVNLENPIQ
jgi:hypothetical protein